MDSFGFFLNPDTKVKRGTSRMEEFPSCLDFNWG